MSVYCELHRNTLRPKQLISVWRLKPKSNKNFYFVCLFADFMF